MLGSIKEEEKIEWFLITAFFNVNPAILKPAPAEAIQFGCTLLRYLYSIHHPNNRKLWSGVCVWPKDSIHLGTFFLLYPAGEPKLIDINSTHKSNGLGCIATTEFLSLTIVSLDFDKY